MGSVTFPASVGGDGSTVTDDSNASTGLANGGHRTRFVPSLAQTVAVAANTVTKATEAAASAASAVSAPGTSATSTTSIAIGTGTKTFTIPAGKSIVTGAKMIAASDAAPATDWMLGTVTSYSGTTLALSVASGDANGSGTHTDWTISLSGAKGATGAAGAAGATGPAGPSVGNHEVVVHTGNGSGSARTKNRRYTTVLINVGTAITFADSAADGASFTINEPGLFELYTVDRLSSGNTKIGASVNSSQGTTDIESITAANRIMFAETEQGTANKYESCSRVAYFVATDVVRQHHSGVDDTTAVSMFAIRKVGLV